MNHHHPDHRRRFTGYQPAEVDGPRGNPPNKGSGGRPPEHVHIRTSLDHVQGRSPTPPEVIAALVRKARAEGVVVFLKADLERMPWQVQAIIEGEHKRLCGEKR